MMVRDFQTVIGNETRAQMQFYGGRLPVLVVACVGGGSNAMGMFHPFVYDASVEIHRVEAAGDGVNTPRHAATPTKGTPCVLHGSRSYLLQRGDGQIIEAHSIWAGLDYRERLRIKRPLDSSTFCDFSSEPLPTGRPAPDESRCASCAKQ
jgi:tryptophan synthase beta chain